MGSRRRGERRGRRVRPAVTDSPARRVEPLGARSDHRAGAGRAPPRDLRSRPAMHRSLFAVRAALPPLPADGQRAGGVSRLHARPSRAPAFRRAPADARAGLPLRRSTASPAVRRPHGARLLRELRAVQSKAAFTGLLDELRLPQLRTAIVRSARALVDCDIAPAFIKTTIGTASHGIWRA